LNAGDKRKENELCAKIEQILDSIDKTEDQRELAELYDTLEQVLVMQMEYRGICRGKSLLPKTQ
jgi:hypothetical protein